MISQKEQIIAFVKEKHFIAKVVSLLLAVILWGYIGNQNNGERIFRVKVEVKSLSSAYVVSHLRRRYITIKMSGDLTDIEAVDHKEIRAYIDLRHPFLDQTVRYPIEISTPPDMPNNISVEPMVNRIFVRVEKKVSRLVEVVPNISGTVNSDYILGNVSVKPAKVRIYGAEKHISTIKKIQTLPLSVENIASPIQTKVDLDTEEFVFSSVSRNEVRVDAEVFSSKDVITYRLPLTIYGKMDGYTYKMKSATKVILYFKSLKELPDNFSKDDLKVWVDLSNVDSSRFITKDGKRVEEVQIKKKAIFTNNRDDVPLQLISIVPNRPVIIIND